MLVKVESIESVALNIIKLRLVPADNNEKELPAFNSGAHIEIGFANKQFARKYTLISNPEELSFYEIAVLKVETGLGGSNWLHQNLKTGDVLTCAGPFNEFELVQAAEHSLLIAGGIGITPILSFVRELQRNNNSYELHYAAKSSEAAYMPSVLQQGRHEQNHFYFNSLNQKLDLNLVIPDFVDRHHLYICGPSSMIENAKNIAQQKKWPAQNIHFESFGVVTTKADQGFFIKLEKSELTIFVEPKQTILEALEQNNIPIDFGCRRGECGACVVEYFDSEVDHRDVCLTSEMRKSVLCACVSRAENLKIKLRI